jgi:hypothetical protein
MGNSGQGDILAGQVQGVKQGQGVEIASDGTISFNPSSAEGVIKTNNPSAFNSYSWPGAISNDAFLRTSTSGNTLGWVARGYGLSVANSSLKTSVPFGQFEDAEQEIEENIPQIGPEPLNAGAGSLYWNNTSSQLFICTGSEWAAASYGPLDLSEELLSGTFTIYVNPEIGEDVFVTGVRESGVSVQSVTAGYSPQRPFKTIQRAALEVARAQNGQGQDSLAFDRYLIRCSPGVHYVDNRPGDSTVSEWVSDPDVALTFDELKKLNTVQKAGVILPRGISIVGEDYRKTVIRPLYVPPKTGNFQTGRGSIFRITGGAFFFNFTFKDKLGENSSHHLLDCFSFVSESDLEGYYEKTKTVFSQAYDNDAVNPGETEIVAPLEAGAATEATDGVLGASPYIFNCAVRSVWGLCGINIDGSQVTGFKSLVTAQFTGVSLQKDPYCWQKYNPFTLQWETLTGVFYDEYIQLNPDDIRMDPNRVSFHIRAINDAFIQEVSVFAIGQGIHHLTESGGEITVTNSNSSFGGCAAISRGYKAKAFPQDKNWTLSRIRVPVDVQEKTGNVSRIYLGSVSSLDSSEITLSSDLAVSPDSENVPQILQKSGYSFVEDSYIWVENPVGPDWRTTLAADAWSSLNPSQILTNGFISESGTNSPPGVNPDTGLSLAVGKRVYIRRLIDTRTPPERRMSLLLNNTASVRIPERNYVLQTDPLRAGGFISRELLPGGSEVLTVNSTGVGPDPGLGVSRTAEVTLRRAAPDVSYSEGVFYRSGTVVKHQGKHYQVNKNLISVGASPSTREWGETFVHMPSSFNAEDPLKNEAPIITFDYDSDGDENSSDLGIPWSTIWTSAGPVRDQYRTSTDYLGAHAMLVAMGLSASQAHSALVPRESSSRERNPSSSTDFPTPPSGGAATGRGNWALEFRRPSVLRLFGHAWEWTGYLNYSKSLPSQQKQLSPQNKFTYYFTSSEGGRVVPQGSNEDGFNVTPRGLEDVETGVTLSVDSIGSSTIDNFQRTDFPNGIQVGGTAEFNGTVELNGPTEFGSQTQAKTNKRGVVRLANADQLRATIGSPLYSVASDSSIDQVDPEVVTYPGLNLWRQSQRLVSVGTEAVTIYVQSSAADRNLNSMFDTPPTTPAAAIPSLARAAEYANAVIGSGNQTARIAMAPGLYDPASIFECKVEFWACNPAIPDTDPDRPAWQLIFPETGDPATAETWFDGSGYGNLTTRVNFRSFVLQLRDNASAGNQLHVNTIGRRMRCLRGGDFRGGFHFLGVPELIKLVADQYAISTAAGDAGQRLFHVVQTPTSTAGSLLLPSTAFTTDTTTNVDTFLNQLRISNDRNGNSNNPAYDSWTTTPVLQLEGNSTDVADLRGIMFGPALPSHKESLGATRAPYIATNGLVRLRWSNLYLRGNATVTSAGMGVTNAVPLSGDAHYGSASVATPWTWRQFHHTFLSSITNEPVVIDQMGGRISYNQGSTAGDRSWYRNSTDTRYLANHIHLLTSAGAEPADNDSGPFLDQFIHAKRSLTVRESFLTGFSGSSTGNVSQGFVGRFGSNGYNSVKARGVLLGNEGLLDQERGATVFLAADSRLGSGTPDNTALSIFKVAGLAINQTTQILPKYGIDVNSTAAGVTYQILSLGSTTQANWNTLAGTSGLTYAVGSRIAAAVNGTTLADSTGAVEPFYGEPHPLGASTRRYNPVITDAALNQADSTFALNMALRSYARGISPEHGFNITPNIVL